MHPMGVWCGMMHALNHNDTLWHMFMTLHTTNLIWHSTTNQAAAYRMLWPGTDVNRPVRLAAFHNILVKKSSTWYVRLCGTLCMELSVVSHSPIYDDVEVE